jgi:cytochrome c553
LKTIVISKFKIAAFAAALVLAGAAQTAQTEGDVARGAKLGYTCLGCHGIDGYRNAYPSFRVPKLGGQKAAYLVAALQGYRDGARTHTTMNAQARSLTDQDIEDVSAYFATLGTETVLAGGTEGASFEAAATCAACHGQNGISMSPMWPTLAGQHEDYLVHALKQYRDGKRKNPVMMPLAAALTDTDIKLLAEYFSDLEGLETPKAD